MTTHTIQKIPNPVSTPPPRGAVTQEVGLYIHIPFCEKKCDYCAFVSTPPESQEIMDRYVEAILQHLRTGYCLLHPRPLGSIFFGGGTPTLLGAKRLIRILHHIRTHVDLTPHCEITLEANPESLSPERIHALREYGVNRISLGAQSFHPQELQTLGRLHSPEQIYQAIDSIHLAGIENLNLDLIFAIPGQTTSSWQSNLETALNCRPTHLSTYGLTYEEGTLLSQHLQNHHITPVLEEDYIEMYDIFLNQIQDAGWKHYEISNACLPEHECRHNLLYWNQQNYLAVGVSAHGFIQGVRYGLIPNINRYREALLQKPAKTFFAPECISEISRPSTLEIASDTMMVGLRKRKGIDLEAFHTRFGFSPEDLWGSTIEHLLNRGWLEYLDHHLRLTKISLLFSNEVFEYFLEPDQSSYPMR